MAIFLVLVVIVWAGALLAVWFLRNARRASDVDRIKNRLLETPKDKKTSRIAPSLIRKEEADKGRLVLELLRKLELTGWLKALIEQAGLKWNVARMMHGCLTAFLAGVTAGLKALPPYYHAWALVLGAVLGALPVLYVLRLRRKRLRSFEEQFPDALEFLSRSMRAGHAFSVSLEMVHAEFEDPLAGEFRRTFDEQNLGLPLDVALQKLGDRVPSMDVHFFVSAVLLQKRTGGNLAELLDKLALLIRERFKLRGRIRAISAHGKMTGTVLSLIPAGVALVMFYVNPSYVMFFIDDATGRQMLWGALGMQFIGFAIIKKIVSIEV